MIFPAFFPLSFPYEILIGLRYLRARRRNHFISFISFSSIVCMALGVMALIVVLSVMNGFQKEIRSRILSVVSHLQIEGNSPSLNGWRALAREVSKHKEVVAVAPYIEGQGMLMTGGMARGVMVRGVAPSLERGVSDFSARMRAGKLSALAPGEFGIVLGADLARALGLSLGDKVTLIAPQGVMTAVGMAPRLKAFTVRGVFEMGMSEYDGALALLHIADAQKLYRLEAEAGGLRVKTRDLFSAPRLAREIGETLSQKFPSDFYVADWTMSHANFFRAVQIEKTMMTIIVSLIVLVAAFSLISTLVMTVAEKEADVAILRTLGARPASISAIFILQGAVTGAIGLALGVTGGVLLALNIDAAVAFVESLAGMKILAKDVYMIQDLPSDLHWDEVWQIGLFAFSLALAATLYPSWRAARLQPAEALRYE